MVYIIGFCLHVYLILYDNRHNSDEPNMLILLYNHLFLMKGIKNQ